MGALCEEAIAYAIKALFDGDGDMRRKAFEAYMQIDQLERDIESLCLKLLLKQQPVAKDLRIISSALKMISDMERIGDQSSDIAAVSYTHLSLLLKKLLPMQSKTVTMFLLGSFCPL